MGAFRAERTVKVAPLELIELGKMGASEKVGAFRANRTEKVGAFRANKTQKRCVCVGGGGFTAAHTRTALIWEYPPPPGMYYQVNKLGRKDD